LRVGFVFIRISYVFIWEAIREVAFAEVGGVGDAEGGEFPEEFWKGADEVVVLVGGAWARVAAGAVAGFGDEFGRGVAVRPGGVALGVRDVFADAGDGVEIDGGGEGDGVDVWNGGGKGLRN
jgi:hypothetical protein